MWRGRKIPRFGYSDIQIILRLQIRDISKTHTLRHLSSLVLKTLWPENIDCTVVNVSLHVSNQWSDIYWLWENLYVWYAFQFNASVINVAHRKTRMKFFNPEAQRNRWIIAQRFDLDTNMEISPQHTRLIPPALEAHTESQQYIHRFIWHTRSNHHK